MEDWIDIRRQENGIQAEPFTIGLVRQFPKVKKVVQLWVGGFYDHDTSWTIEIWQKVFFFSFFLLYYSLCRRLYIVNGVFYALKTVEKKKKKKKREIWTLLRSWLWKADWHYMGISLKVNNMLLYYVNKHLKIIICFLFFFLFFIIYYRVCVRKWVNMTANFTPAHTNWHFPSISFQRSVLFTFSF